MFMVNTSISDKSKDQALIQVLADRLKKQRLPRALSIKERVDNGGLLNDLDIYFLKEVFRDSRHILPLIERNPEWKTTAVKVIALYKSITDKALENEENYRGSSNAK